MVKIVVVGGGLAGTAAAAAAVKAGADVTLLERMEILGGWGAIAGHVNNDGFGVFEELRLMGGYDIFDVIDHCLIHINTRSPWPPPGTVGRYYDIDSFQIELERHMERLGVKVMLESRAKDTNMEGNKIKSLVLDGGEEIPGDVFVDATGGFGPPENCKKYGNGCVLCFMRCPAFGNRVSIAQKAGVKELKGKKPDGSIGPMTAAFTLVTETLAPELRKELQLKGFVGIPIPQNLINYKRNENITQSMNVNKGFAENMALAHIGGGYTKRVAGSFMALKELRKIPGLERAKYADPLAGTKGNSIRFMALTPRNEDSSVPGVDNLFVASEKMNVNGVIPTILTGVIAGHNAVRRAAKMPSLVLPSTTMCGDFMRYVYERWDKELIRRFTPNGGPYLARAKENGLYTLDKDVVRLRVEKNGLVNILAKNIVS
jgi:hypothetical protein